MVGGRPQPRLTAVARPLCLGAKGEARSDLWWAAARNRA
jgi:hypothetical protein